MVPKCNQLFFETACTVLNSAMGRVFTLCFVITWFIYFMYEMMNIIYCYQNPKEERQMTENEKYQSMMNFHAFIMLLFLSAISPALLYVSIEIECLERGSMEEFISYNP